MREEIFAGSRLLSLVLGEKFVVLYVSGRNWLWCWVGLNSIKLVYVLAVPLRFLVPANS